MSLQRRTRAALAALLAAAAVYLGIGLYRLARFDAYRWFPVYVGQRLEDRGRAAQKVRHVIFLMVDHFEPSRKERQAVERVRSWLEAFDRGAAKRADSYGRAFRYSWFLAAGQAHEAVLEMLSERASQGLGEIELHWHHGRRLTNERLGDALPRILARFARFGALISSAPERKIQFAFIHGNWGLDGSDPLRCGVTRELDILRQNGCYADMTFSTIGTVAQPWSMINSIYYAVDDDGPKSYERGVDSAVGRASPPEALMIFEGPLGMSWTTRLEYGALEDYALPSRSRIEKWLDEPITIEGRPEWAFLKVYSHGIQSRVIVERYLAEMLAELKQAVEARGAKLHFVTAREAFNIVKAAEAGESGDPEQYRDYLLPPPLNALMSLEEIRRAEAGIGN